MESYRGKVYRMKLTNNQVKQIIKEEINRVLNENISSEKMMVLAEMFLSENEEDFKQALMLLESLGIFQKVSYKDKTTEFPDVMRSNEKYKGLKRERYEWLMLATPEFYIAAAEVLGEIGRFGPNVVFDKVYTDGMYRWTYSFFRGREPEDMAQLGVKKQIRPDY